MKPGLGNEKGATLEEVSWEGEWILQWESYLVW
jgi:hypothetical protein